MSNIKLNELNSSGYELFEDSESFLNELSEEQTSGLIGGAWSVPGINVVGIQSNVSIFSNGAITANGNSINANTVGNNNSGFGGF